MISGLTGVDDPYEEPLEPDARIDAGARSVAEGADEILALLTARGLG